MSLLSRFRKTVLPSNSRNKKVTNTNDNVHHYNYRRPTKSFNEKSIKPKSSQSCADSFNDKNHHDLKGKSTKNSNKIFMPSLLTTNKSTKNKIDNPVDNSSLSRSNTFTLEEEVNLQNATLPRSQRKEKCQNLNHSRGNHGYYEQRGELNSIQFVLPHLFIFLWTYGVSQKLSFHFDCLTLLHLRLLICLC